LAGLGIIDLGYPNQGAFFKRTNQLDIPVTVDVVLNDKYFSEFAIF
jgi:hypothetical protein